MQFGLSNFRLEMAIFTNFLVPPLVSRDHNASVIHDHSLLLELNFHQQEVEMKKHFCQSKSSV